MIRKTTLVLFAICAILLATAPAVFTNSEQPPAGRTGCNLPPTEQTCGTSTCHGNLNTGPGSVTIAFSDPNLKYAPGITYDLTVTAVETGKVLFGFEITVVDAAGGPIGTFIIPGGSTTIVSPPGGVGGRDYLSHKDASSVNSWSFQWTAPATAAGDITFFAAGNCANGNGNSSGDNIYTSSLVITPDNSSGIFDADNNNNGFSIKNLTGNVLTIQTDLPSAGEVSVDLYDAHGRLLASLLKTQAAAGAQKHNCYLDASLSHGIYLVHFRSGNAHSTEKILIGN